MVANATPVPVTISSGTSISNTTFCNTTQCPPGTYRLNAYLDITTACTTGGTYQVNIHYTDDQGSKNATLNFLGVGVSGGIIALSSIGNFGEATQILRSTGAAVIQYNTTAVACGSGGPMSGDLYLSLDRVQ
jgi:hypothetical protein